MAITGRAGLIALLVTLAVLVASSPGVTLAVADGALVLVVLADVVLAGSPRRLTLTRDLSRSGRLGEPLEGTLIVAAEPRRTMGSRRVRATIRDAWPPSAGLRPPSRTVSIPAGERIRLPQRFIPTRRGDRTPVTATVRCYGPLRLGARQRNVKLDGAIRVQPAFPSRKLLPEKLSKLRIIEGLVATRGPGRGTEFDSLREYVRGDDIRAIDWRATARRGGATPGIGGATPGIGGAGFGSTSGTASGLMVRQYRPERDRRLIIVLDTGRTSAGRVGDAPRLDAALDAGLLLAAVALRAGDRVDLLAADAVPRAQLERATLASLSDTMAGLEPALVEADAGGIAGQVLRLARRRCLVVLFTDLAAAPIEEGLLPSLAPLLRRHEVMLASVADPRVAELATGRGAEEAVYAAAAAERSIAERARLAGLLRRRGVEVVDVVPEHFAGAVADRYLTLKAAGLL
jgi:uncharacterized protein (DUF58 family)